MATKWNKKILSGNATRFISSFTIWIYCTVFVTAGVMSRLYPEWVIWCHLIKTTFCLYSWWVFFPWGEHCSVSMNIKSTKLSNFCDLIFYPKKAHLERVQCAQSESRDIESWISHFRLSVQYESFWVRLKFKGTVPPDWKCLEWYQPTVLGLGPMLFEVLKFCKLSL